MSHLEVVIYTHKEVVIYAHTTLPLLGLLSEPKKVWRWHIIILKRHEWERKHKIVLATNTNVIDLY